jgi:ATP-dependent Clp protease adaptor protein ClpS
MKRSLHKEKTDGFSVKLEIEEPVLYKVMLVNDDFTAMDFIVRVLEKFFNMDRRNASEIMTQARLTGSAVCGLFTKDIAETKIEEVKDYAVRHEFPLICSMEAA